MERESTADMHPQDWCLIVEALGLLAREYRNVDDRTTEWAWDLITVVAEEQGLSPSEMIKQRASDERAVKRFHGE